jgi:RNA polymerase sigma factor (sigma-70 family)
MADSCGAGDSEVGSEQAWSEAVSRHACSLRRYCHARGVPSDDVEDIVCSTFAVAVMKMNRHNFYCPPGAWLMGVLKIEVQRYYRAQRREDRLRSLASTELSAEQEHDAIDADSATRWHDLSRNIGRSLSTLTAKQRKIFVLRVKGWSFAELGAKLHISEGNACTTYHQTRTKLLRSLQRQDNRNPFKGTSAIR